jgi:predicted nucleic acid-binding protein
VILVDTNVIVDVLKADPVWLPWSSQQLMLARRAGPLCINYVVYAELAAHEQAAHEIDAMLDDVGMVIQESTRESARLAAAAFRQYRRRGGARTGVLPDFFIGAQALAQGYPLLTRDASRYRSYFPALQLISP